jgi:hypothetical protein
VGVEDEWSARTKTMQHILQTHILRAHMLVQRHMLLRGCGLLDKANWVSGALAWRSEPERHPGV